MRSATTNEIKGLKSLAAAHKHYFVSFYGKLEIFASSIGFSVKAGDTFADFDITAADFTAAGFTTDESTALLFIVADGATDLDGIDRWIIHHRAAVALLAA